MKQTIVDLIYHISMPYFHCYQCEFIVHTVKDRENCTLCGSKKGKLMTGEEYRADVEAGIIVHEQKMKDPSKK